ncbi:MAG TPA: response regulator transcription factor [Bacteroidota bacterium]
MTKTPVTILIADDHPLFRKGLREIIGEDLSLKVVHEAGNGEDALAQIEALAPQVAVLDIDMPKATGLEVARAVQKKKLPVEVIILTLHDEAEIFEKAMELGVMGYVLKDGALTEIVACIHAVAQGKPYISPHISRHLIKRDQHAARGLDEKLGLANLTPAERNVLKLIARSKTTKEIADELSVSPKTIDNHRSNICTKLNIHGTNALLRFALENKELL